MSIDSMKTLIFFLALFLPVRAAPAWFQEANVPKNAPLKKISPTKLSYSMTWNGRLKAGSFDILFGEKDPRYPKHFIVRSHGGSTGWAHALFPYQFNYTSFLNPKTMRPIMFVGTEKERKEVDVLSFRFTSKGVTGTEKDTEDGVTKTKNKSFAYPHSLDLFSGLLQIRSMPLKNGDTVVMPFHPIATPYLAKIKVLSRETHMGRACIKLDIGLQKIDKDLSLKHYTKLKTATVWLSDDAWRVPVEINAKVFVGHVRVFLTKHENL
ncbi:MAG: hypothetical protein ACI9NQ_000330 [Paracoccaceae bacterium]|jgi:hypothetical protein